VILTLLRHGEPARSGDNAAGSYELSDPPLSSRGRAQARAAAPHVVAGRYDVVYASPLRRAQETASIAAGDGVPVAIAPGLAEFDHGTPYLHFEDGAAVWDSYLAGDLSPWGTSLEEFGSRVQQAADELAERHAGQRVLAVCHGGVVNAFACRALGVPDRVRVLAPDYCSFHRFSRETGTEWRLLSLNEVAADVSTSQIL
jgi:2,3-bisphosphoglycerate-dependent phosphoglycerate mutase